MSYAKTIKTPLNNKNRFTLASNKLPKLTCPKCGKKRHFQQYLDTVTGEALPLPHGKCDNLDKCGEWITPKATGFAKALFLQEKSDKTTNQWRTPFKWSTPPPPTKPPPDPPRVYIPFDVFSKTLEPSRYDKNGFIKNLLHHEPPFERGDLAKIISMYKLGTVIHGKYSGAVTFPFIDSFNRVTSIQVKLFNENQKTRPNGTNWIHGLYATPPQWVNAYNLQNKKVTALFGEHLLTKYPNNPIALVEAPKTAIYAALFFGLPEDNDTSTIIWLATGGKTFLNNAKLNALDARKVIVYPDLSKDGKTFNEWSEKCLQFAEKHKNTLFKISDYLERHALPEDRASGYDLADYLIGKDWTQYRRKVLNDKMSLSNLLTICQKVATIEPKADQKQTTTQSELIFEPSDIQMSYEDAVKDLKRRANLIQQYNEQFFKRPSKKLS